MQTCQPLIHARFNRRGELSRRDFLQLGALGVAGSTFLSRLSRSAEKLRKEQRACIFVWLAGAPSQFETWDPKAGHANGGQTKAIGTSVPGLAVAEYWPKMAAKMKDVAVLRTITGKEAAHERGTYHMHTGRRMGGPERFPNFGSVVAYKLGDPDFELPNFVSIGQTLSSGFLGVKVAPFVVNRPGQLPANVAAAVARPKLDRRLRLLQAQEADFAAAGAQTLVEEHQALYERAARLMRSPRLKAFQLDDEPEALRTAYGNSPFGRGLLVARRLVEAGVPFVEVRRGGWDMHNNLYQRIGRAAADADCGLSQLLEDLKVRGMLERTLVVVTGEFGRTPKMNQRTPAPGRDHWARNFNLLLAGAGVRGGIVVGRTSANGQEIVERPVPVVDLFQSLCRAMGLDADEDLYTPAGRPMKIVDGGQVVGELFS